MPSRSDQITGMYIKRLNLMADKFREWWLWNSFSTIISWCQFQHKTEWGMSYWIKLFNKLISRSELLCGLEFIFAKQYLHLYMYTVDHSLMVKICSSNHARGIPVTQLQKWKLGKERLSSVTWTTSPSSLLADHGKYEHYYHIPPMCLHGILMLSFPICT